MANCKVIWSQPRNSRMFSVVCTQNRINQYDIETTKLKKLYFGVKKNNVVHYNPSTNFN